MNRPDTDTKANIQAEPASSAGEPRATREEAEEAVRVLMRWVPAERNWADGPSRGQSIGYFDQASGKVLTN